MLIFFDFVSGKFDFCRGGLKVNDLKRKLCQFPDFSFGEKKVLLFIGMNDMQKVWFT